MKKLQFTQAFGNFVPGDVIEVEDDAIYDGGYLSEAPEGAELTTKAAEDKPAGPPRYKKKDA